MVGGGPVWCHRTTVVVSLASVKSAGYFKYNVCQTVKKTKQTNKNTVNTHDATRKKLKPLTWLAGPWGRSVQGQARGSEAESSFGVQLVTSSVGEGEANGRSRSEAANIAAASQCRSKMRAVVVGDGVSVTSGAGWTLPLSPKTHRRRLFSHPCPGCPCPGAPAGLEASE